jgi:SAM-dependent methyltransferase
VNSCLICKGSSLSLKTNGATPLLYCADCDVHILEQPPLQQDLDTYYAQSYVMSEKETFASEHRRLFRLPEMYWLISQLETNGVDSSSSILDIGCDKGYFLDQCRRFGYSVQGVEPSDSARAYCNQAGLDVKSNLHDILGAFNAITLWHVLEHFTNPHQLIHDCTNKLHKGGKIFIRVPDFTSLWSRLLRSYWIWFQPKNHYVHYSKKALISLLNQHDFEIMTCISRKPNNHSTFKAGLLADAILIRNFGYKQSVKKFLGRIYEHITGVELYVIAKKR